MNSALVATLNNTQLSFCSIVVSLLKIVSFSQNSTTFGRILRRGTNLKPIPRSKDKPCSKDIEVSYITRLNSSFT